MTTYTFRLPDHLLGRLSSAQMRSWLADFLRQPHSLPPDPGSGEERVSLTLPREAVEQAGGFLGSSPSAALRRIAADRLGISVEPPRQSFAGRQGSQHTGIPANSQTTPQLVLGGSFRTRLPPPFRAVSPIRQPLRNPQPARRISGIEILLSLIPGIFFLGWLVFALRESVKTESGT